MDFRKMNRIVTVYIPPNAFEVIIEDDKDDLTIYECVEHLALVYEKKKKLCRQTPNTNVPLDQIINLHNTDGIQDLARIRSMLSDLKTGKELFMENGLPNIKLVITKDGKHVLFDGHHTLIAYMLAGRKNLSQVPHIIVKNAMFGYIIDKDIHVFFGRHAPKLCQKDWREYVINWQVPKEHQLCPRVQKNMGELSRSIRKDISE